MSRIIVTGIGTDVGKTVVCAILTHMLQAAYWKPIQCGDEETSDTHTIKRLIDPSKNAIFPPAYSLTTPVAPHQAARMQGLTIDPNSIVPPSTTKHLIIETCGGILVPLTPKTLTLDLFIKWEALWIIVSQHYLGSINHTLLTFEALKQRKAAILGVIFNGEPNLDTETAILEFTQMAMLGRLLPEKEICSKTLQKYGTLWEKTIPR